MPRTAGRPYFPDMSYFAQSPEPLLTEHQNRRLRRQALLSNPYRHADTIRTTFRNRNSHYHIKLYNMWLQTERLKDALVDTVTEVGTDAYDAPLYTKAKDINRCMQGFLMKMMTESNFFIPFEQPPRAPSPEVPWPAAPDQEWAQGPSPVPWPRTPTPDPFLPVYAQEAGHDVLPIPEPNPTFIDTPAPPEYAPTPAVMPHLRHPRGDVGAVRAAHIHRISLAAARSQIAFESTICPATPYPFPVAGPSGR